MKLWCLLLFFLFFSFTECMIGNYYRNPRTDRKVPNYASFIRRGKNHTNELTKQLRRNIDNSTYRKESIFGDVIQNITRVNNVLEELIKSYEKLQIMYKSHETSTEWDESENESSDTEVNEPYKQMIVRAKESTSKVGDTRKPNKVAKEMFYDEKQDIQVASKMDNADKKANILLLDKQTNRDPFIQLLREAPKKNVKGVVQDPLTEDNDNVLLDISNASDDSGTKGNKVQEMPKEFKQNEFEIEFKLPRLDSSEKNASPLTGTVVKAEEYTPDFWDRLAGKAPIHLRTEKLMTYGPLRNNNNAVSRNFKEQKNHKTKTLVARVPTKFKSILVKTENKIEKGPVKTTYHTNRTHNKKEENLPTESVEWSMEDDKTIEKEQFKTSILRKAYGDACLKVVVEKCFKACKQVTQTSCEKYHCKQNLINAFKDHSTIGCTTEFNDETVIHRKNRANDKDGYNDFVDITRSGYLAAACLPPKNRHKPVATVPRTKGNLSMSTLSNQLKILRDKFEVACQKASAEKCKRACYYATNQVCSIYDCNNAMKSNFARECRGHCKEAYRYADYSDSDYLDTDEDTGDGINDSSSASENTSNDSRSDSEFQMHLNNGTAIYRSKNTKKVHNPGLDTFDSDVQQGEDYYYYRKVYVNPNTI